LVKSWLVGGVHVSPGKATGVITGRLDGTHLNLSSVAS
jgi:hypothetical protein